MIVAAFDFDGTLTRRDTVVPFLRGVAGTRTLVRTCLAALPMLATALLRRDRNRLRAIVTARTFAGRSVAEVGELADDFGHRIVRERLRADTLARLRWHQRAGHAVVIVSASYDVYVDVVARQLGIDGVVATRLEIGQADAYSGRLVGPNCRGREKARRLRGWLDEQGMGDDELVLWAYGDSAGDRELLAIADHPVWVRRPLASVAPTA